MEFRKMVTTTLYARQQKRHRCIEQSFGLCGRGNLCAQPQQITPVFKLSVSIYYMMCKKKFISFCLQYDKVLQCIYFLFIFFLLYNIVLVLPYNNMHLPLVYTYSSSWTPVPPPSPYHPSGSSKCTIPKLPVSCIEPGLAIHFLYDIIHVLMPFS